MKIYSPSFGNGEPIPARFSCEGDNINPELIFEGVPQTAKSLILIVDDPDVPKQIRGDKHFTHWLLYNLPANLKKIDENSAPGTQGKNDTGQNVYTGPCPPTEFEPTTHRYFFKLYALDKNLNLPQGITQKELERAIKNHILKKADYFGTFTRVK